MLLLTNLNYVSLSISFSICTFTCVKQLLNGFVVDHTLLRNEKAKKKSLLETKELWQKEYPDHPFDVALDPSQVIPSYRDGETSFSYDIISAASRQKEFGYQVIIFIVKLN